MGSRVHQALLVLALARSLPAPNLDRPKTHENRARARLLSWAGAGLSCESVQDVMSRRRPMLRVFVRREHCLPSALARCSGSVVRCVGLMYSLLQRGPLFGAL